jgi:hypothetical protein
MLLEVNNYAVQHGSVWGAGVWMRVILISKLDIGEW